GARQQNPVAERHSGGAERDREEREAQHSSLARRIDGGSEEQPDLPDDHRQSEYEAGVEGNRDRHRERPRDAKRKERAVGGRQRLVQPREDMVVEDVGEDRAEDDRSDHHEEPAAQLLEVLAERRLLGMAETARKLRHVLVRRSRARAEPQSPSARSSSARPS